MLRLTDKYFEEIDDFFEYKARDLEKYLFRYYFEDGNSEKVVEALKTFQNSDGGFGHGLESDFRLPLSSPMATSVGIRILSDIDDSKSAQEIIKQVINYLESAFNEKRNGWFVASREINDYPHAPWWHFNEEKGMTIIDNNWGNPSAELLAYLYKYREYVSKLDVDYLVEYAVRHIEGKEKYESENELFCYIKLFEVLKQEEIKNRLLKRITFGISQVVEYNKEKWNEYVPMPLNFVSGSDKCKFGIKESKIGENLEFYLELIQRNGVIIPPWGESFYQGSLKPAYDEWKGVITLKVLKILDNYGLIER